jgi:uncharacterized protein (DUF488 family)
MLGFRASVSTLFTIGHSAHSTEKLAELLRSHHISVVVDTRSAPYSRFAPQFDRELLQRSLVAAGIRYLFLGAELGGVRRVLSIMTRRGTCFTGG